MMRLLIQQLQRHWRIAELRLLFLALCVSITAVTSVGFFTDRADRAMLQQATELLGGDLVLTSARPMDKAYLEKAQTLGIASTEMISFPSMVVAGKRLKLAQIKAVSSNYPLQGELRLSDHLAHKGTIANTPLQTQELWAEARLMVALNIQAGAKVNLGRSTFSTSKVITQMPDQGSNAFQFAPHVLISLEALKTTGLLTPASRARFSYLFAGDETQITALQQWLEPQLKVTEKIRSLDDGLPAVQQALQRGQRFLGLASLLSVILAGAAIALTSYSLSRRETPNVAVLKTLGASRKQVLQRYLLQLFIVASLAAITGIIIGYILQFFLALSLQDFIGQDLPAAGLQPAFIGLMTAWLMALGFSLPQLLRLINTAPVQILQGQFSSQTHYYPLGAVTIIVSVFLLMWLQTHDVALSFYLLIGVLLAITLFSVASFLLLSGIKYWQRKSDGHSHTKPSSARRFLRFAQADLRTILLVVVFGTGLFSLLLLTTLRGDLLNRWQNSLPAEAPNNFLINIQPQEREPLQAFFRDHQLETELFPMTRGRLKTVNGEPITVDDFADDDRAQRLLEREFNISTAKTLPSSNRLVSGEWFSEAYQAGLSVEEGLAKTLKLKQGDELSFDIAGQPFVQTISSIREVNWDSMQPNFFVLAAHGMLEDQPRTYISSIYVADSQPNLIPDLIKHFPSVTAIDLSSIIEQIRSLIDKAAFAVQAIFAFTLLAGIIVLFAALQSQKAERRREIAVLKSLGANRSYLQRLLLSEFVLLGALSGLLAGLFAMLAGNIAAYALFELAPTFNLWLLLVGMLSGATLVSLAGYWNLRSLLNVPPVVLFQE